MPALIAFALIAIVALIVISFVVHFLFSPWLLLLAVAALAYYKFGPRRSRLVARCLSLTRGRPP